MKLGHLRPLYEHGGPYASVYLPTDRHSADAAKAISLHWRHARIELSRLGVDDPTLDAIEEVVIDRRNAAPGRAVFAAGGEILYTHDLPEPPQQSVRYGRLPDVLPLLERCSEEVPIVQVKADRQGADIIVANGGGEPSVNTVDGADWPIRKVKSGGWSHSHIQRNAEETWEQNARAVAAEVAREAREIDAELILVGGDVRARELVLESLPEPYVRRAVPAERGVRAAGADEAAWEEEVAAALRAHDDERHDALIARFREAHGRGDAVAGLAPVVEALRAGQVETLLVAPPVRGELCYGERPHEIALDEQGLADLGVHEPRCESAGSVLVRSAVATDAELEFTDALALQDGTGALLRYTP
ncbi:hypothetical protein DPM19_26015 [Actinomadura craniellae]|uniref:Peptide chain release factor 1 n=1 Tax=Actinomadura craniellae TaxID=2231787 RepID=A0A365GZD5_9ACTN|nr:Vms1/Ankzf1 family peptidyl-tRNA hydrolase [Actinomadura craniellae]RAY12181.1 hypothetical protein DPM19_26015 [Actinomadura craniellae]